MQKPIQSWDQSKSSESMNYIMELLSPAISLLGETKAGRAELANIVQTLSLMSENLATKKEHAELASALSILSEAVAGVNRGEILGAVNMVGSMAEKNKNAILAIAEKLDANSSAVPGLDANFLSTVNGIMSS